MGSRTRTCAWLLVGVGALWLSNPAHAEPRDEARRYFIQGLEAARDKNYEGALEHFLAAQRIYEHPATLYNIARAYGDLGEYEKALEYYSIYRDAVPEKADEIDPMIAVLKARLKRAATPAPVAATAPTTSGGGAATAAELERLQAIAAELSAISADLAERKDSPQPVVAEVDPEEPGPDPVDPSEGELGGGDFLSDAYERTVVTASRYGQSPLDSPSTVTILTEEDIRASGSTNIPDLLRRVAGVDVMSLAAGQPEVSVRGFNRELSNKVLVLLDGRPLYIDLLGTPAWGILPISLQEIERIEIIRGPGSAVYGANAVTGIINIITRKPGDGDNLVRVEAGSPGYSQGTAMVTGKDGEYSYRMSLGYHQTGTWDTEFPVSDQLAFQPLTDENDLSLRALRTNARVDRSFANGKGFGSVTGGYVVGANEFYVIGTFGDWRFPFEAGWLRGDLSYGDFHLRAFYNSLVGQPKPWGDYVGARSLETTLDSDTVDIELEGLHEFETGKVSHTVNYGLGYRFKSISWTLLRDDLGDPIIEHHNSLFAQETANIDKLSLVGSLRLDRHPLIADLSKTLSPRAAAIYRVADKTSVRVTGGTSFRAPTQMESYTDICQPSGVDSVCVETFGDVNLNPERIATAEVGLSDESTAFHRAEVSAYVNQVSDLIAVKGLSPEVNAFDPEYDGFSAGSTSFVNSELAYRAYGLEAEGRLFPVDGLDIYANGTLSRILETADGIEPALDGSTSAVKLNAGVIYRSPLRIDVSGHVHYVSAQTWRLREFDDVGQLVLAEPEIPARTIASAWLAARPFKDEALELELSAWNIASLISGEGFQEHPKGQRVTGRLFGAATYRF